MLLKNKQFLKKNEKTHEPKLWFHYIYRVDESPYNKNEINLFKQKIIS